MEEQELATELRTAGFDVIETHISRVFLRGTDVYKTKRRVSLGFLDFSTSEARERACEAEVALNRRLAPDVYLGVLAIVRSAAGELAFMPREEVAREAVLEWAVHMRRLSDDDRADVRLAQGRFGRDDVLRVAAELARFHRGARADAETARFGLPAQIAENVEENFAQVAPTIGSYLDPQEQARLTTFQRDFLARERALLEARARDGFVRDGHGDLRLEHLYATGDGRYLAIDCIEFNERFRFADVCADLAFLTMDLTHHERPDLAEALTAAYAEASGDYALYRLLDFYQSYRAVVRATVTSILAEDEAVSAELRERARKEARRYYLLGLSAACRPLAASSLIVTFGLIASGKSTLASGIGRALSVPVLSADRTRKELLGMTPSAPRHDPAFAGAYSAEMTDRVYQTLLSRAEHVLSSGRSVVLDASFRTRAMRARARELADDLGVRPLFFECVSPRETIEERLRKRAEKPSVSDGRAEIFDAFAATYEPPHELADGSCLTLDTVQPPEQTLQQALAQVGVVG